MQPSIILMEHIFLLNNPMDIFYHLLFLTGQIGSNTCSNHLFRSLKEGHYRVAPHLPSQSQTI